VDEENEEIRMSWNKAHKRVFVVLVNCLLAESAQVENCIICLSRMPVINL